MSIITIRTGQAPDAKPERRNLILSTNWQSAIEVPRYLIPEETFGGTEVIVPGVAEIISPLLICNVTTASDNVSVRAVRYVSPTEVAIFTMANEIPVGPNDIINLPLNGQFFLSGDRLEIKSNTDSSCHITISYTVGQAEQDDVDGVIEVL